MDRPPVSGEPTWECGASDGERPGYICGRPAGHKGMHRRRAEASTGADVLPDFDELANAIYESGVRQTQVSAGKAARSIIEEMRLARLAEQEGEDR